jgi:hypothetical protein
MSAACPAEFLEYVQFLPVFINSAFTVISVGFAAICQGWNTISTRGRKREMSSYVFAFYVTKFLHVTDEALFLCTLVPQMFKINLSVWPTYLYITLISL